MVKKIKIVQVLASLNKGGIETWLKDVITFYDKEHYQIDFILMQERGDYASLVENKGSHIHVIKLKEGIFTFTKDLYKVLRREKYDVVHAHPYFFSGYISLISFFARVPLRISHSHNDHSQINTKSNTRRKIYINTQRFLLKLFSNKKIAASVDAGKSLFKNESFEVLYCGIDFSKFIMYNNNNNGNRQSIINQLNIPDDAICIGHVGRFVEQKNHQFLIDIFKEVNTIIPNSYLLLVGVGKLKSKIKSKVISNKVNNVIFLGLRDDVDALMKYVFDVFLFPSLHEGLGIVLVEAQAANLPCVISDSIPKEAVIVQDLVSVLPLNFSPQKWANSVVEAIKKGGDVANKRKEYTQIVENSPFDILYSVKSLEKIYSNGKPS